MFAVIKTGGKQYRVATGDVLKVEKIAGNAGDVVEIRDVLLIQDGEEVKIGNPVLKNAVVQAELVERERARKVIAFKKRRRKNSRRSHGHRQELTRIRVREISA